MELAIQNANTLEKELGWYVKIIETKFDQYFNKKTELKVFEIVPPILKSDTSTYAQFVNHYELAFAERFVLLTALIPHINPRLFDVFFTKNSDTDRVFTEFGGYFNDHDGAFIPTGETICFILAGDDLGIRFKILELFEADHIFARHNILKIESELLDAPLLKGKITLSQEFVDYFTQGKIHNPTFSSKFPARLIETKLEWTDLVLEKKVFDEINLIISWIKHQDYLLSDVSQFKHLKNGYRALFYGPPGTGKTLTAGLIGKKTGKHVYSVDLSMVVSKWVGETEKNLGRIFDLAEKKDWILFFDEADSLFGKRTETKTSNEKHANQEVAYLLQRTENFNGTIILASNMKGNMDEAFTRRFQSLVYFPIPGAKDRLTLWQNYFNNISIDGKADFKTIANKYELAGGNIINVLKYCAIKSADNLDTIKTEFIIEGVRRELLKDGKTL